MPVTDFLRRRSSCLDSTGTIDIHARLIGLMSAESTPLPCPALPCGDVARVGGVISSPTRPGGSPHSRGPSLIRPAEGGPDPTPSPCHPPADAVDETRRGPR